MMHHYEPSHVGNKRQYAGRIAHTTRNHCLLRQTIDLRPGILPGRRRAANGRLQARQSTAWRSAGTERGKAAASLAAGQRYATSIVPPMLSWPDPQKMSHRNP